MDLHDKYTEKLLQDKILDEQMLGIYSSEFRKEQAKAYTQKFHVKQLL